MDTYLPADFHQLRDDVVTDWRDLPTRQPAEAAATRAASESARAVECSVDPTWLAI
jgi:hypothetical protein